MIFLLILLLLVLISTKITIVINNNNGCQKDNKKAVSKVFFQDETPNPIKKKDTNKNKRLIEIGNDKYFQKMKKITKELEISLNFEKNIYENLNYMIDRAKRGDQNILEEEVEDLGDWIKSTVSDLKNKAESANKAINLGLTEIKKIDWVGEVKNSKVVKFVTVTNDVLSKVDWNKEALDQMKYFVDPKVSLKEKQERAIGKTLK
jgi:hypothetical protein